MTLRYIVIRALSCPTSINTLKLKLGSRGWESGWYVGRKVILKTKENLKNIFRTGGKLCTAGFVDYELTLLTLDMIIVACRLGISISNQSKENGI